MSFHLFLTWWSPQGQRDSDKAGRQWSVADPAVLSLLPQPYYCIHSTSVPLNHCMTEGGKEGSLAHTVLQTDIHDRLWYWLSPPWPPIETAQWSRSLWWAGAGGGCGSFGPGSLGYDTHTSHISGEREGGENEYTRSQDCVCIEFYEGTCLVNISNCLMVSSTLFRNTSTFREDHVMWAIPALMARSTCKGKKEGGTLTAHVQYNWTCIKWCQWVDKKLTRRRLRSPSVSMVTSLSMPSPPHLPGVILHEWSKHIRYCLQHPLLLI